MPIDIPGNIAKVRERIGRAAIAAGRSVDAVTLMAVSKTQSIGAVRAAAAAGVTHFGENYLQEALGKIEALGELPLVWHFIGPIQSNKTRSIAEHFAWVHSIDRLKVAERLSAQRPRAAQPLNVCIQVNISAEPSKSGVTAAEVAPLAGAIASLAGLRLRGLMAIPGASADPLRQYQAFQALRTLAEGLPSALKLDTLSMGMSADLEAAIAAGATTVRIGSDIFGSRPAPASV